MDEPKVMIRGIYTTALTKLLTDKGFLIAQPSHVTVDRFKIDRLYERNVNVFDREDRQGIVVEGEAGAAESALQTLSQTLPDMIAREKTLSEVFPASGSGRFNLQTGFLIFDLEFPYASKIFLDNIRNQVVPTIENHHLLKTIEPDAVDAYESLLDSEPAKREELSRLAKRKLVYEKLIPDSPLKIEHVKPDGSVIELGEGKIRNLTDKILSIHRRILSRGGKYDGLEVPKSNTDFAVTFAEEGSPVLRHSYYASDGTLKGEFYNINTPTEFYPDRIRYVDLEIDVIKRPGEEPEIVDAEKLDDAVDSDYISRSLAQYAKKTAQNLALKFSRV